MQDARDRTRTLGTRPHAGDEIGKVKAFIVGVNCSCSSRF